jgi:hypothetical protein
MTLARAVHVKITAGLGREGVQFLSKIVFRRLEEV